MATALDALRVCGLTVAAAPARGWMTAAEHAGAIAEELARADHDFALRLLRQALEDLDHLATSNNHGAIDQFLAQPPSIEDERWERLLVVTIAVACDRHGVERPAWADVAPLDEPFFPARPSRRFIARTVERTPPDFAQANIWMDMAFLPNIGSRDRRVVEERPGPTNELASARVLLAMKMASFRAADIPDLMVLFEELEIESSEEAARITRELYGPHSAVIADDADDDLRLQAEDILERLARSKDR